MKVITRLDKYEHGQVETIRSNSIDFIPRTNTIAEIDGINYRIILTVFLDQWHRPKNIVHCSEHILVLNEDYEKEIRGTHFVLICGIENLTPTDAIVEIDNKTIGTIGICGTPIERHDFICSDEKTISIIMKLKIVSTTIHLSVEQKGDLETLRKHPSQFGFMTV